MNTYSHESHICVPQERVLDLIERFWHKQQKEVEILALPESEEECGRLILWSDALLYLVAPTDEDGWTLCWCFPPSWPDDDLVAFIAEQEHASAIYGHWNDMGENWRWIIYQSGAKTAEYRYTGCEGRDNWVRFGCCRPQGAMLLPEAFRSLQRAYHHLAFWLPYTALAAGFPPCNCKLAVVHL